MNDKEKIQVLKESSLAKEKRINELFRQNEELEKRIFNYQIWVGALTIVIIFMIWVVW